MSAEDRLAKLFEKKGITFSIETLASALVLITITKDNGRTQDTVGGTYESVDEGINDCIDKLDNLAKKKFTVIK